MKWYHYVAWFFVGAFLANSIPHFVHGVAGDMFPSPFSDPPGKGLSSPIVNVLWGLLNMAIAWLLYIAGKPKARNKWAIILFVIGFIAMSIISSITFADKMH